MKRHQRGFSLAELLIVVGIILIVAAIAIPNLVRSRIAANEASAVGSIRTLITAASTYKSVYSNGFPAGLVPMGAASASDTTPSCDEALLIDNELTTGTKTGYNFTYADGPGDKPKSASKGGCEGWNTYTINGDPVTPGASGERHFFADQSGVIRFNASAVAGVTDAPVQ